MTDDGSALQFVSEDVNLQVLLMLDVIARRALVESVTVKSVNYARNDYPNISDEDWDRVVERLAVIVEELYPDKCLFDQAYGFLHGRQLRGET
jgi:hypothetical protein